MSAAAARVVAPLCNRVPGALCGLPSPGAGELHPGKPARRWSRRTGARPSACRSMVAGAQRSGEHPGDLRAHAGDGRRDRADLRRGAFDRRHLRAPSSGRSPPIRSGTARLFRQTGKGKGDAVRLGFAAATGDILMILDADLTVPPEDLPRFYEALHDRTRGSSSTACAWSTRWRTRRCASSTCSATSSSAWPSAGCSASRSRTRCAAPRCCGATRTSARVANRAYFGDFDPFGDFDLLFGAAKLGLEIVELPIRYRERTYGETNIQRWRHGWLLLKMCVFAAGRIKFV